ncbi:MAG: hypothetical protein Q9213_003254 [Squamulea squamosa]
MDDLQYINKIRNWVDNHKSYEAQRQKEIEFRANFLNKNEEGGLEAADELSNRVKDHLIDLNIDVNGTDIIVRAYANIGGLAQACTTKGGMTKLASLGSFVKGFNGRRALFDFVDVGGGKERADHKIRESLTFYTNNAQCRRVLLGVAHDAGYAPFLQDFASDKPEIWKRITVLEGYYTNPAIEQLGFERRLKMSTVFAAGPAPSGRRNQPSQQPAPAPTPTPNPAPATNTTNTATTEADQNHSDISQGPHTIPPAMVLTDRLGPVQKDAQGYRVDKPLAVDPRLVAAIKELHLCPRLYLKGYCKACGLRHDYKPLNTNKYDTLWLLTRRNPCMEAHCNDPNCIRGHK